MIMNDLRIGILIGSKSDLQIAEKAIAVLENLGIAHELRIISAHRTPEKARIFAETARENNFAAIIAIAGKAAHLAGSIAALTSLPVIGVPVKSDDLGGMDALLSTVQMPAGIPVATVAINGGENAAWLAAEILAVRDETLCEKLRLARENMRAKIFEQEASLNHD